MSGSLELHDVAAIRNGTRIANNGGDECVAAANLLSEGVYGHPFVPVASAKDWWERFEDLPQLYENFTRNQTPAPGAIVVWKPTWNNVHGHIGDVLSVNPDGSYNTLEQNWTYRWAWHYTRPRYDAGRYGFLHPNQNIKPKPSTPEHAATPPLHGSNEMIVYYKHALGKNRGGWLVCGFTPNALILSTQASANFWQQQIGRKTFVTTYEGFIKILKAAGGTAAQIKAVSKG